MSGQRPGANGGDAAGRPQPAGKPAAPDAATAGPDAATIGPGADTSGSNSAPRPYGCILCGAQMYGVHCKLICPNCGYREDCSDLFPES